MRYNVDDEKLTVIQKKILAMLASGMTYIEISRKIKWSVGSIYSYVSQSKDRVDAKNLHNLIALSVQREEIVYNESNNEFVPSD